MSDIYCCQLILWKLSLTNSTNIAGLTFCNALLSTTMPESPKQDLAVDVQNFTFDYGGPAIVKNLNLQVPRGERCLLVGANGAGKTTLLRILAGKRKFEGHVRVLGHNAFLDAPAVPHCKGLNS